MRNNTLFSIDRVVGVVYCTDWTNCFPEPKTYTHVDAK